MDGQPTPHDLRGKVSLLSLFTTFLKVGLFSFGGGLSGWIYQEVVVRRRWITNEDFFAALTIAQLLPGANVTNMAVYVGNRVRGAVGATIAVTALLVGPFVLVIVIAEAFAWLSRFEGIADFLDGIAAAAVGMLLSIGLRAGRDALTDLQSAAAFGAVLVAVGFLGTSLVSTVIVVGIVSLALSWVRRSNAR